MSESKLRDLSMDFSVQIVAGLLFLVSAILLIPGIYMLLSP